MAGSTPVVAAGQLQQSGAPGGPGRAAVVSPWPFPVGALESSNRNDYQETKTMSTGQVAFPNVKIQPEGWLRGVWLEVDGVVTGNTSTVTFNGDTNAAGSGSPMTALSKILFRDTGTEQIFGEFNGFDAGCTNKFGGYQTSGDPRNDQNYSTTTGSATNSGSFHFSLYIPLEISARDALGALENRSENSIYKIELTLEQSSNVYVTAPSSLPAVTVRATQDSYYEPNALSSLGGRPTADAPPSTPTVQYWKQEDDSGIVASAHTSYITNGIGYGYRTMIFKLIRSSGTRANGTTDWPDPQEVYLGTTRIRNLYKKNWQDRMGRDFRFTTSTADSANGPESGVFVLSFAKDAGLQPGDELRRKYLRTKSGQTFKLYGTYGNAGTLYMTSNYVIPKNNDFTSVVA